MAYPLGFEFFSFPFFGTDFHSTSCGLDFGTLILNLYHTVCTVLFVKNNSFSDLNFVSCKYIHRFKFGLDPSLNSLLDGWRQQDRLHNYFQIDRMHVHTRTHFHNHTVVLNGARQEEVAFESQVPTRVTK